MNVRSNRKTLYNKSHEPASTHLVAEVELAAAESCGVRLARGAWTCAAGARAAVASCCACRSSCILASRSCAMADEMPARQSERDDTRIDTTGETTAAAAMGADAGARGAPEEAGLDAAELCECADCGLNGAVGSGDG